MMERSERYTAVSRAAWGYFFPYFNFNLATVNLLPAFVSYLLFLSAIRTLSADRRDLVLLRPLGILLGVWHGIAWVVEMFGRSLDDMVPIVGLVISLASLYFHFQLITDLAALAADYQDQGERLDLRLLKWRTVHTVLLTVTTAMGYAARWLPEWWTYLVLCVTVVCLIACICIMAALFRLRKCIRTRESETK